MCYDTVGPLGGFHCDCDDGYYGPTCNYTTNPCVNEHCSGNGHCRVVPNIPGDASALCTCNYRYGWAGNVIQCNIPLRFECLPRFDPCQNGGQCSLTDDPEDYTCICPPSESMFTHISVLITFRQALNFSLEGNNCSIDPTQTTLSDITNLLKNSFDLFNFPTQTSKAKTVRYPLMYVLLEIVVLTECVNLKATISLAPARLTTLERDVNT